MGFFFFIIINFALFLSPFFGSFLLDKCSASRSEKRGGPHGTEAGDRGCRPRLARDTPEPEAGVAHQVRSLTKQGGRGGGGMSVDPEEQGPSLAKSFLVARLVLLIREAVKR